MVFLPPKEEVIPEYSNPYANLCVLLSRVALFCHWAQDDYPSLFKRSWHSKIFPAD